MRRDLRQLRTETHDVAANGLIEIQETFFRQRDRRSSREGLGHRTDLKKRIGCDEGFGLNAGNAESFGEDRSVAAHHRDGRAGDAGFRQFRSIFI